MLKLAYSDIGIHIEHLSGELSRVIAQRKLLAHLTGQTLHLEPSYAAVIIPDSVPEVQQLETAIATANDDNVSLCASLSGGIEVILQGCWMACSSKTAEGAFFAVLEPAIEDHLTRLWSLLGTHMTSCTWPTGQALSEAGYEF